MSKQYFRRRTGLLHSSALLLWVGVGPISVGQAHAQECSISAEPGATLIDAKNQFAAQCPEQKRGDCDRINGAWQCSTDRLNSQSEGPISIPSITGSEACTATGSSRSDAIQAFNASCPSIARQDCDPTDDGNWVCSSENIKNNSTQVVDTQITLTTESEGLFVNGDLLALHYDNCPDRDDGHAMAAGKAVVEKVGITNVIVVNGTCGADIKSRFQTKSPAVAIAVWGDNWLDAIDDEQLSISTAANSWAATLSNENDVWVAEGGPSDFTANVLRRIGELYPSVDRKRVHIVQHAGWNEDQTSEAGLAFVQRISDYILIDNGNVENNGSAGLNKKSNAFVNIALQSRYANEWEAAFDYLDPDNKLDFSDTVELLHIVGDTETANVDDFAQRYLVQSSSESTMGTSTDTTSDTTTDNTTDTTSDTAMGTSTDTTSDTTTDTTTDTTSDTATDTSTDTTSDTATDTTTDTTSDITTDTTTDTTSDITTDTTTDTTSDTTTDTNSDTTSDATSDNNSELSFISTPEEASRFLMQAAFGGTLGDINALVGINASEWIENEIATPQGRSYVGQLDQEFSGRSIPKGRYNSDFLWESMIKDNDELRLRMAFALSQIMVASDQGLGAAPYKVAYYMDILEKNAFGNYRDLLEDITYSPMMARYLTYFRNRKADLNTGREPDENYAREIMQLFTIGLTQLNPDGTNKLDATGNPIETYDNNDIVGLSRVFTGLSHDQASFSGKVFNNDVDRKRMKMFDDKHSEREKQFLGVTIPTGTGGDESIKIALDTLFAHPNVGPFVSRQLIQRFTSSNPDANYVRRVSETFESGIYVSSDGRTFGTGKRGDLAATIAAILLDDFAHASIQSLDTDDGKVREPVLRLVHLLRAFDASPVDVLNNEAKLRDTSSSVNELAQHPIRPPSVFNFYRPGFIAANTESGDAGLTIPELQIVNDGSIIGITNFLTEFAVDRTGDTGSNASLVPNYQTELQLAENPEALVAHVDLLLTAGALTEYNKQRVIEIVRSIEIENSTKSNDLLARVHATVVAILSSNANSTLQ